MSNPYQPPPAIDDTAGQLTLRPREECPACGQLHDLSTMWTSKSYVCPRCSAALMISLSPRLNWLVTAGFLGIAVGSVALAYLNAIIFPLVVLIPQFLWMAVMFLLMRTHGRLTLVNQPWYRYWMLSQSSSQPMDQSPDRPYSSDPK